MAAYDDLNTKRIFTVGIISIVVTAVTALAVQVIYYSLVQWHEAELSENSSYRRQNKILADQTDEISSYGVNPATGNITIPVEKAMELIATDNPTEKKPKKKSAAKKSAAKSESSADNKNADHDEADHKDGDHKDADDNKESDTDAV